MPPPPPPPPPPRPVPPPPPPPSCSPGPRPAQSLPAVLTSLPPLPSLPPRPPSVESPNYDIILPSAEETSLPSMSQNPMEGPSNRHVDDDGHTDDDDNDDESPGKKKVKRNPPVKNLESLEEVRTRLKARFSDIDPNSGCLNIFSVPNDIFVTNKKCAAILLDEQCNLPFIFLKTRPNSAKIGSAYYLIATNSYGNFKQIVRDLTKSLPGFKPCYLEKCKVIYYDFNVTFTNALIILIEILEQFFSCVNITATLRSISERQ